MSDSIINPPNTPLIDDRQLIRPEWYRFLVAIQRRLTVGDAATEDSLVFSSQAMGATPENAPPDVWAGPALFPATDDAIPPLSVEPEPILRDAPLEISTDADASVSGALIGNTVRHTGALTAGRLLTLVAGEARAGSQIHVVRTGSGAFDLSLGGLKALATGTWAIAEFDGTAWFLTAYGAL